MTEILNNSENTDEEIKNVVNESENISDELTPNENPENIENNEENGGHLVVSATFEVPSVDESSYLNAKPELVYRIGDFEGPFDLMLTLIKNAKINIDDLFVSDVTSQYVDIVRNTPKEDLDYEYAGEFITLAAELVYLKSKRALPVDENADIDDDLEDRETELINKIKEYAILKEESDKLRDIETINRFTREPTYTDKDYRVSLTNFSLPKLIEAYARVLANADKHSQEIVPKKVVKDRFSVHEQMHNMLEILIDRKQLSFIELIDRDYDKNDIVTTFLAMLELIKYGKIKVDQNEIFGDITLYAVEGLDSTEIVFEENDDGKY